MLWFAEPPWPADMQVFELAPERMGPVVSPRLAQETGLAQAPAARCCRSRCCRLATPGLAGLGREPGAGGGGAALWPGFEHLYYLLEAAVAGLGVAIAPEALVRDDLAAGRLAAPWGFIETDARLALWYRRACTIRVPGAWRNGCGSSWQAERWRFAALFRLG